MPQFSVYKLRPDGPADPGSFVDFGERSVRTVGPIQGPDFTATLYLAETPSHRPSWAGFLAAGFTTVDPWPQVASASALVIVQLSDAGAPSYAMPFGSGGRFLLQDESYQRGFGLKAALNLIYPTGSEAAGRLRTMDMKRRQRNIVRSRLQSSAPTEVEEFNIDQLLVSTMVIRRAERAGGVPAVIASRQDCAMLAGGPFLGCAGGPLP